MGRTQSNRRFTMARAASQQSRGSPTSVKNAVQFVNPALKSPEGPPSPARAFESPNTFASLLVDDELPSTPAVTKSGNHTPMHSGDSASAMMTPASAMSSSTLGRSTSQRSAGEKPFLTIQCAVPPLQMVPSSSLLRTPSLPRVGTRRMPSLRSPMTPKTRMQKEAMMRSQQEMHVASPMLEDHASPALLSKDLPAMPAVSTMPATTTPSDSNVIDDENDQKQQQLTINTESNRVASLVPDPAQQQHERTRSKEGARVQFAQDQQVRIMVDDENDENDYFDDDDDDDFDDEDEDEDEDDDASEFDTRNQQTQLQQSMQDDDVLNSPGIRELMTPTTPQAHTFANNDILDKSPVSAMSTGVNQWPALAPIGEHAAENPSQHPHPNHPQHHPLQFAAKMVKQVWHEGLFKTAAEQREFRRNNKQQQLITQRQQEQFELRQKLHLAMSATWMEPHMTSATRSRMIAERQDLHRTPSWHFDETQIGILPIYEKYCSSSTRTNCRDINTVLQNAHPYAKDIKRICDQHFFGITSE